jgi:hypothetical protein
MAAYRKDPLEMLKNTARMAVHDAIAAGKLVREDCFCGKFGEGHHDDYSEPLKVRWLCKFHHTEVHYA